MLFVSKANVKLRLVVDYRPLNQQTVVDQYPLPRIDELLDQAGRSRYFSKLDLHAGFHQILLNPNSVPKTAFKHKFGSCQYLVLPFGLCNPTATFQRTMDLLIKDYHDFAGMCIDDLLVFSETLDEHVNHLRKVLLCSWQVYFCSTRCGILWLHCGL